MRFYESLRRGKMKMATRGEIPGNKENKFERGRKFIKCTY